MAGLQYVRVKDMTQICKENTNRRDKQVNYRNRKKSNLGWSPDFDVADCASNWFRMNLGQTETDGGKN